MELVDKNKITFEPIEIYNIDEHKHEITGMALFKDIEKIPIIKAIPLDEIKQAIRDAEASCVNEILDVGGGKVDVLVMDVSPKRNVKKSFKGIRHKKILYKLR